MPPPSSDAQVSLICILIAVATFFIAWKGRGLTLFESFHAAVGVAVALIPEGAFDDGEGVDESFHDGERRRGYQRQEEGWKLPTEHATER